MSQYVESPTKSFPSGAALEPNRRVKLAAGVLQYAGASDPSIGVLVFATFADSNFASGYTNGTVRLVTAQGTHNVVASEAITSGNPFYAAANGKVAATGTIIEGKALESATADGDVIEGLGLHNTDVSAAITGTTANTFTVDSDTAGAKMKLTPGTYGGNFTQTITGGNLSSVGDCTLTLPAGNHTLATQASTETLTGKTLGGILRVDHTVTPVAAAGSTVADAGQLGSTGITHITSDGATKGVKFPTGAKNDVHVVINDSSTAAELYAATGGTVNGLSANASVVIPASKGVIGFCTAADTWIVFDLPAKATAS